MKARNLIGIACLALLILSLYIGAYAYPRAVLLEEFTSTT